MSQLKAQAFTESTMIGYRWSQHQSQYGGIQQRWLVVESKERQESDLKRLEKNLDKAQTEATKQLRELSRQSFACVADTVKAAHKLSKKLKYHQLVAIDTQDIQSLKQAQSGIKNQLGRLTERPTLRWIFQCFQAVHLLQVDSVKQVSNLTDERLRTLSFFPATCQAYYLIH